MKKILFVCKKAFPWMVLVLAYTISVGFLVLRGRAYLDSDMASEMILANMLNQEGSLISDNWYASTGFPIFTVHPFFQIGLLIFPNDWNMARAFGMAIMLALLAVVFLWFTKVMNDKSSRSILFTAVILCPFGFWYMNLVTFGGYYLPALIIMILGAVLIFSFCSEEGNALVNKRKLIFVLSLVVAFCGGLKDVRCLMNLYVPIAVATFCLLVYGIHSKPENLFEFSCREWRAFIVGIASLACNVLGYLINTIVFAKRYSFQGMTEQTWGRLSIGALLDVWGDFLSLFGYQNDEYANSLASNQTSPQLFSLQGIISAIGLVMAFAIIFSFIRLLQRWKKLMFCQQLLVMIFGSIFLINGVIFAWTEGYEYNVTYWTPLIPFALMLIETEIATESFSLPSMRKITAIGFVCCVFCTSYATLQEYQLETVRGNPNFSNISTWLLDNGYTEGYASFWNSNVLTVLSNGQLEMWTVYNINDKSVQPWLQKREHTEKPPQADNVFVVIGPGDDITEEGAAYSEYMQAKLVFTDEFGYSILELSEASR